LHVAALFTKSHRLRSEYFLKALSIKISRQLLAELITHALQDDPNECCGLLLGKGDEADELHRMSNVSGKPISRYTMQPAELVEAQEKAKKSDREFTAIYHSHTFTQGYPSLTDIKNAVEVGSISTRHVIISLVEKTRPVVRAFSINEKSEVTELVIQTDGDAYRASD
jgi:proteasome lid subunit RPN8/RPN11